MFLTISITISFVNVLSAEEPSIIAALSPYIESHQMPGVVSILATPNEILSIDSVGYSDIENQKPIDENSFFWIASMSKAFGGVCVMILVEEGKLDLDAPISTYLPELSDLNVTVYQDNQTRLQKKLQNPMTLRQNLSHTAGWPFITSFQDQFGIDSLPTDKFLATLKMTGLDHEPGTKYQYSNIGIDVAAAVVERVSGMPFEDFLQQRVFEPLEMTETTFFPNEDQIARLAKGYRSNEQQDGLIWLSDVSYMTEPFDHPNRYAECGGGLFSTPIDLIKFYQMLAGGGEFNGKRILSEESVKLISSKQTGDKSDVHYGFGLACGDNWFGHGGAWGTNATIYKNHFVALYMVQVAGVVKQEESIESWRKAAMNFFDDYQK
ncbi:MAG: serine hydrolase domain-containing protein [Planctomycetia bacterium]|nr:serine hydrolase domain-containing protein [Planctomycetia bacterium]